MKLYTPFYSKQVEYGVQWQPSGLWQRPAVYTSVEEEYRMVRERAGFIDYSFQSMFVIAGSDAFDLLQKTLTNDLRKILPSKTTFSPILNETGTIIDVTIVLWVEENLFILSGEEEPMKQLTHETLKKNAQGLDVYVIERGKGVLALQGPRSRELLQKGMNIDNLPHSSVKQDKLDEIPVIIARGGYTGELGYEIFVYPEYAHELWDTLMELGKEYKVGPYAAPELIFATEKGMVSTADFYEGSTPLEVGLAWAVGFDKGDFTGKDALLKRKSEGLKTKLMGLEVSDPEIVAAKGDSLIKEGKVVGQVTRGVYGPAVGKSIGFGWVEIEYAREGEELEIEHEGKRVKIKLVRGRWYDPENKKMRG